MRVISGSARGLKLKAPEGLNTRPTTDRIKESLFNIIAADLYDICFLDLFGGSGGIGIEALSRGARKAYFADSSRKSIDIINDNLKRARLDSKAVVMNCDFRQALNRIKAEGEKFDIVFLDPPYNTTLAADAAGSEFRTDIKLLDLEIRRPLRHYRILRFTRLHMAEKIGCHPSVLFRGEYPVSLYILSCIPPVPAAAVLRFPVNRKRYKLFKDFCRQFEFFYFHTVLRCFT